jgi:methanogenic corrinoid protein MtbC1
MLNASGYEVIDLGVDVVPMEAIQAAENAGARFICLSALMTTSMPYQKDAVELLSSLEQRDDFFVVVGGGPVTREYAGEIGANGWAPDAASAVKVCNKLLEQGKSPASGEPVYGAGE